MRKAYSGNAARVTLDGGIFLDSTGFVANSGQGFPTGTDPFVVLIGRGTLNEEKLLVTRSGNAFTIVQRAYDGTIAKEHGSGEYIEHVIDATTLNEFNAFANGQIPVGSVAAPSIGFVGGGGFYQAVDNEIQVGLSGVLRTAWVGDQFRQGYGGGAGAPAFSFIGDPDTGLQRGAADTLWLVTGAAARVAISNSSLIPVTDSTGLGVGMKFGGAANRWDEIWARTTTISTSDITQKFDVSESLGLDFVSRLEPVTAKLQGGTRPHGMLIAQQVKQVMEDLDIDFAGYVDPAVNGDEGPLGLRYEEFIPPLVQAVKQLKARVEELEAGLK